MKVIILAAGVGQRLGDTSANLPKCLLEFGGSSLLQRHLQILEKFPVSEIMIVTGYRKEDILTEIDGIKPGVKVRTTYNPDYTDGSVISLWHASELLLSGEEILLMDADVLYDPRIMQKLIDTEHPNCFLLDRNFEPGDEPVKLCIDNGRPVDFRKKIDADLHFDFQGESVGFFRFSASMATKLAARTRDYLDNQRVQEPYEEVIRDLLLEQPAAFAYEDISAYAWIEIDFPEDIERAKATVLDKLQ